MNHTVAPHTEEIGKSMAIRLLIHYVGDFHQPLHCATRVNKNYPKGDLGGNMFKLTEDDLGELHAVWDSIGESQQGYANLPFNAGDWEENGETAKTYRDSYDVLPGVSTDLDVDHWAQDDM